MRNGTVVKITSNNPQNTVEFQAEITSNNIPKQNKKLILSGAVCYGILSHKFQFLNIIFSHTFLLTQFFIYFHHMKKNLYDRILNGKSKEQ